MLNRLKAAFAVLFSPRYIAVTYDSIFELRLTSNAPLVELHLISNTLCHDAEEAVEMECLVEEAKMIVER